MIFDILKMNLVDVQKPISYLQIIVEVKLIKAAVEHENFICVRSRFREDLSPMRSKRSRQVLSTA